MTKTRWIWASTATIAILATLGAGLWFGRGPATRAGWEAAAWAAGITTALALIATAIAWAAAQGSPSPPEADGNSGAVNTVNGTIPGGTAGQGRDVHVDKASYDGDHVDFRGGTFHGPVTGKQTNISHPGPGADHRQEPNR